MKQNIDSQDESNRIDMLKQEYGILSLYPGRSQGKGIESRALPQQKEQKGKDYFMEIFKKTAGRRTVIKHTPATLICHLNPTYR